MLEQLSGFLVDESKWFALSTGLAIAWLAVAWVRHRDAVPSRQQRVLASLNLLFGVTVGTMAFGHLVAVTIKLVQGTLPDAVFLYYVIGVALAAPSWWLVHHAHTVFTAEVEHGQRTLFLNGWLMATLLAMGPQNLPLVAPGLCNVGYQLNTRHGVGVAVAGLAAAIHLALFAGGVFFFASGQGFEQFRDLP